MNVLGLKPERKKKQDVGLTQLGRKARHLEAYNSLWDDVKKMLEGVKGEVKENEDPAVVVFRVDEFREMRLAGLKAVLNNIKNGKSVKLGIRVPAEKEQEIKVFLEQFYELRENIILLPWSIEEANNKLVTEKYKNIVFAAKENEEKPKGVKVFGIGEGSEFHAVFLFGVMYARASIRNELAEFMELLGIPDSEIEKMKSGQFFVVKLIRIVDILNEFNNRRITVDVAA